MTWTSYADMFGAPETAPAYYGRAIYTHQGARLDIPFDRAGWHNTEVFKKDPDLEQGFLTELNQAIEHWPSKQVLWDSAERYSTLGHNPAMTIVMTPNQSHGYVYIGAWLSGYEED